MDSNNETSLFEFILNAIMFVFYAFIFFLILYLGVGVAIYAYRDGNGLLASIGLGIFLFVYLGGSACGGAFVADLVISTLFRIFKR